MKRTHAGWLVMKRTHAGWSVMKRTPPGLGRVMKESILQVHWQR